MAKANPVTGASHYLAEGQPVPDDLPPGVRMVGPGAPAEDAESDVQDEPQDEDVQQHEDDAPVAAASPEEAAVGDGDAAASDDGSEADSAADGSAGDDDEGDDYDDYPIRYLRELCRDRGLSPTGSKAELVTRLEEHDGVLAAAG